MIIADFRKLAPYFRNGLLYFPEKTIHALLEVGLDWNTGHKAMQGISLDDSETLDAIGGAIDLLLGQVDANSPFYGALTSDDAYFMLTGRPLDFQVRRA